MDHEIRVLSGELLLEKICFTLHLWGRLGL